MCIVHVLSERVDHMEDKINSLHEKIILIADLEVQLDNQLKDMEDRLERRLNGLENSFEKMNGSLDQACDNIQAHDEVLTRLLTDTTSEGGEDEEVYVDQDDISGGSE